MEDAGLLISKMAIEGAKLGDCGKMCHDCAFRVQDDINAYSETTHKALMLLEGMGDVMNCHTSDYKDAGKPCVGFLYASQYIQHAALQTLKKLKNDNNI